MEADVYLNNNFLEKNPQTSKYYCARKQEFKGEWKIRFNEKFMVYDIEVGDGNNEYILCGVSYWTEKDGCKIIKKLEEAVEYGNFKDLFWDDIVKDNLSELEVFLQEIDTDDCYEIDSLEDFEKVNNLVKA
jgi:CTP:phosphocholine cytidylyltransferase-like protein